MISRHYESTAKYAHQSTLPGCCSYKVRVMETAPELSPTNSVGSKSRIDLFSSPRKRTVVLSLLLILITLGVYNSICHNGFINLDDNLYVTQNQHVQAGVHWSTVKWALTSVDQANWHPLTWLSHALDWQLFKTNAGGHHYVSLVIHALNVVLLFLLLQNATGFTWRSLIVAALFAVHPVGVESVAWVAERKNVLSMTFFLLALLAYGHYARRPSARRYLLVALCFVAGLMAKPQVITLPCVLLLWDYWPLGRFGNAPSDTAAQSASPASFRWLMLEKLPLLLLSAGDALITMYAQRAGNAVRTVSEYSLYGRVSNSIVCYSRYMAHAFWPLHLSPTYAHPGDSIPLWQVALSATALLTVTALVVLARRRYLLIGWLWFLGILVPMIGIVQVGDQAMADRYAYIPFIGLFCMAVWGVCELWETVQLPPHWLAVPACVAVVASAVLCHELASYWHDSEALWDYAISIDPGDFMAHANRGRILVTENRSEEAIRELIIAQRLHTYRLSEVLRFADYEIRNGHADDAAVRCQKVLHSTQDPHLLIVAWTDLGIANVTLGNYSEAGSAFESALKIDPQDASTLMGLGLLSERNGQFDDAIGYYSRSVRTHPSDVGLFLLGTALEKSGRHSEADAAYAEAERASSDLPAAIRLVRQLLN